MSINLGWGGRGLTAGRYLDGKSVGKLSRIVGSSRERERGMREEQQSARNVASARGMRVVSGGHQTLHAMALREHRDGVFMFLALLGEV